MSLLHPRTGRRLLPTFDLADVGGVAVPLQSGAVFPSFEIPRTRLDLGGEWLARRIRRPAVPPLVERTADVLAAMVREVGADALAGWPIPGWEPRTIPGPENRMCEPEHDLNPERFESVAWYATRFEHPDASGRGPARLVFLSVNYVADLWVDGRHLGTHEGGYGPFSFLLDPARPPAGPVELRVRVANPPWGSDPSMAPAVVADWCNYAGIVHDVYVESLPPLRVDRLDAVPDGEGFAVSAVVTAGSGQVPAGAVVRFSLHDARPDSGSIEDPSPEAVEGGQVAAAEALVAAAGGIGTSRARLVPPAPRRWSPARPELYVVRAELVVGEAVADAAAVQAGLRTVGVAEGRLRLDGRPAFLCGVARHEDGPRGRTSTVAEIARDLRVVKGLGADLLRAGHYPNHPATAILADRIGLAVASEIPVWQHRPRHFQADAGRVTLQMWREMTWRDRNRPSVLFWSAGNECCGEDPPAARAAHVRRLRDDLRARYDDGRLVMQSAAADAPGPGDASQEPCDVAGWTLYFGIFHGGTFREGTRDFLERAAERFPGKPLVATEFGFWSSPTTEDRYWWLRSPKRDHRARHGEWEGRQVEVMRETAAAFEAFLARGGPLCAVVWWTAFDWHRHVPGLQTMGLVRMDRTTEKPAAAEIRAVFGRLRAAFEKGLPAR
ncbi:MAG: hypothetical protein FJ087_21150 [Deltaproteobacteria bacterium]|nr:hypothetical protein [Deltaproteobacteria bacterium]